MHCCSVPTNWHVVKIFLVFGPLNKNKLASEVHIITTENPNPLFWRKASWTFLGKLNSFSWAKVIFVPWQGNLTEIESDIFLLDGIRVRVKVGVLTDDDPKSQTVKVKNKTLWAFLQILQHINQMHFLPLICNRYNNIKVYDWRVEVTPF